MILFFKLGAVTEEAYFPHFCLTMFNGVKSIASKDLNDGVPHTTQHKIKISAFCHTEQILIQAPFIEIIPIEIPLAIAFIDFYTPFTHSYWICQETS